ncbi:MAG: type II secretion system F family protein [Pseudomonadota bacterium]
MARFRYKALGDGGEIRSGQLRAESREDAIGRLRRMGVVPLSIEGAGAEGAGLAARLGGGLRALLPAPRPQGRDLMLLTRELFIMLSAGVTVDRALAKLDGILRRGALAGVPGALLQKVKGGGSLGDAMATRPDVFPAYYVGMVRAGEAGGALAPVLKRLSDMVGRNEALRAKIRSALTYPLIVLTLTGFSLVILFVYVVPEFRPVFEQAGEDMPAPAAAILAASELLTDHGSALLLGLLAVLLLLRRMQGLGGGRLDRALLHLPLFGGLVRRIETARFCRTLGTLRANGVPLVDGVAIAAGTLGNRVVAAAARAMADPLARGEGLAGPMQAAGVFPELAVQLVEVGEESGKLQDMLLQVAEVFDEEVEESLQRLLALLTPLMTVLLGGLIAFVIGTILSAILSSYDLAV